ncbi:branched-chain amino acid ABC transporter permease [Bacillus massilinigeriensis]|uniref:branched-chain amino acid ABC transporter permease n=1 Tax=Bacillus massilionigeriensis TaxID=1805475 RepID=UPI00096AFFE1|nr:branched-chain amino acid ABC transporter permease [Bacillus massilionigeriensis]
MFICLLMLPFANDSRSMLILFTQIFIFAIFAMSYDILLGYTGIVSFGHCMFFGIGSYSVAIMLDKNEPTLSSVLIGLGISIVLAALISYMIGLLSLRLKSHFYAMLTLAISQLFLMTAEKWRTLTHGGDGFTFRVPHIFSDRLSLYYVSLITLGLIFLSLWIFTHSNVGRVLRAISQNERRVEAMGFKTIHYKVISSIVAGVVAAVSGGLYVLTLRFVNTSVFSVEITLDALLMTMIGGIGTLIGAILGSGMIEYIQDVLSKLAMDYPIFERWNIFLGILYVIVILGFPTGVVGAAKTLYSKKEKNQRKIKKKEQVVGQ